MAPGPASSSSTELVAGFRVERRVGDAVWAAFQPELARRVALRRLEPGTPFAAAGWPERPGVVALFAVVTDPSGTYVATRWVPGARTLTQRRVAGVRAATRRRWLDEVAATLDGVVHGCLTEHDILIDDDGHALVTGFGRAPAAATADDDRAALQRMRKQAGGRRRWLVAVAGGCAVSAVAVAGAIVLIDRAPPSAAPAPALTAGTTAMGSALVPGPSATVDCAGAAPTGSSVPCTIMATTLRGRPLVVAADGLVRAWAVRGARGPIALQVLRPQGEGFVAYNRSPTVTIADGTATKVIAADLSVPKGARFALEVAPGGAVGIRRGVRGAATARFFGPLRGEVRRPDPRTSDGEELLLRVDVVARG